jgi:hypothetical protein
VRGRRDRRERARPRRRPVEILASEQGTPKGLRSGRSRTPTSPTSSTRPAPARSSRGLPLRKAGVTPATSTSRRSTTTSPAAC